MNVRAKFTCTAKESRLHGTEELVAVKFSPVYKDKSAENAEFWKWTPCGSVELGTINKSAADAFELGKEYYLDFSPAAVPSIATPANTV